MELWEVLNLIKAYCLAKSVFVLDKNLGHDKIKLEIEPSLKSATALKISRQDL